ncbi:unnamed protein product, partial [Microthlaspi erraticum]
MKLLFPEELIDENLEGFKEKVTRTLKLFPKAVVPRDIHGEIVYPAVNHPPDTHCKEKRLGGSRCLLSLSSPERQAYSQAKDLKQALHGRQPMRIEGEKGVKTQSAPKHWPRTRKSEFWPSNSIWPTVTVEPGRNKPCSAGFTLARQNRSRTRTNRERSRDRPKFCIGTDRPCRSIRETYARPRPNSLGQNEFGRPNRSTATKSIGHRPKTFLGQ